jgi:small-conductance mechanosensitive channel
MVKENQNKETPNKTPKKPIVIAVIGLIISILLIMATLEISHRGLITFVATQQKYILAIESIILVTFVVELLVRLVAVLPRNALMMEVGTRLRFIVRVVGYSIGLLSIVAILASNSTLGISVGAIVGAVILFSTQNIVGSVLASMLIMGKHIIRVGEEITVGTNKGTVADINLTHTIIASEDEVIFIPNSVMISTAIRRKKRSTARDTPANDW